MTAKSPAAPSTARLGAIQHQNNPTEGEQGQAQNDPPVQGLVIPESR